MIFVIYCTIKMIHHPFPFYYITFMRILCFVILRWLNKIIAIPIRPMYQVITACKPVKGFFTSIFPECAEVKHDPYIADLLNNAISRYSNLVMNDGIGLITLPVDH